MWQENLNDKKTYDKLRDTAKANILNFIESLEKVLILLLEMRNLIIWRTKAKNFIARELFRNPNILILDEATSARLKSEKYSRKY